MTLADRRERGDLIEVNKILKGLTSIDPAEFWEVREARSGVRLIKELAANGNGERQRYRFFSYREPATHENENGILSGLIKKQIG